MNDPSTPSPRPGDSDTPARDPYGDPFASSPQEPTPAAPSSADPYQVIDPYTGKPVDAAQLQQPQLDPAMMAPPPLNPPVTPGAILGAHHGGAILTLGIVSIVTGIIGTICCALLPLVGIGCGIAAIIWGGSDLRAMDAGLMDPSGRSPANSGRICGIAGVAISSLGLLFTIGMIVFSVMAQP